MSTNVLVSERTPAIPMGRRLLAHIRILRLDHCIKQIFILPGIVLAIAITGRPIDREFISNVLIGMLAATLISSSNYVLNEMLDAPFDRIHPTKCSRPAAEGLVHFGWGYVQWIAMMVLGLALASTVSRGLLFNAAGLWVMGCLYNIPPIRTKDIPYVDVLSESINNPLRFCLGWYMVTAVVLPPASLLVAYWMLGAYFMVLKRFSEHRQINDPAVAAGYRKSFLFYNQESLLSSAIFYAVTSMLFLGAFIMRYRIELILAFPMIALLMSIYFKLAFGHESSVQNPEKLYREPRLMSFLALTIVAFVVLLFVDVPWLGETFVKSQR
jgi:decaprenyl-phosphate phosphoribosyltransferase